MPKVSILVPFYNGELYLSECLESIVNQSLREIEIICINDGSKDRSLSIIQEYKLKDKRIKLINKLNTGYGHSINIGLRYATGEYIGIVESDDIIAPEMFEKLYTVAKTNHADVVKSNYFEYVGDQHNFKIIENLINCKYNYVFSPMDDLNIFFTSPSIWSGIYKKSYLIKNNIQFLETPGASFQDTSFAFKVWVSAQRVYLMHDAYLYYRSDNMDSSVNSSSKIFSVCDEYEEIESYLNKMPDLNIKLTSLVFAMKFKTYKWNYYRIAPSFQYAFLLKMVEQYKKAEKKGEITSDYLTISEVKEAYKIINNYDQYFMDTAREYHDHRLFYVSTLNSQLYKRGLFEIIDQYKNVIIYGAGKIGITVVQKLIIEKKDNHIKCFAVSDLAGNPVSLLGYPVYPIQEISEQKDDSVVLVAVKEQHQYELIRNLRALNFNNIISVDAKLLHALS